MLNKFKYRVQMISKLHRFTYGVRRFFWVLTLVNVIGIATSLLLPQLYKIFIDDVIIGKQLMACVYVIGGYLTLFVVDTLLAYIQNYTKNRLVNKSFFHMKQVLLRNYLYLPFSEYEKRSNGDLKFRIEDDMEKLNDFAEIQIIHYIRSLITAIITIILLFSIEWRLAIFSLIVIPITMYFDHIISKREKKLLDTNRENDQQWNSWLQNSIQGWKEIKALNQQKRQEIQFVRYTHHYVQFNARWINYWTARVLVLPKIKDEFLMKFLLYFFGGLLVLYENITIGSLLMFALYYAILSTNIRDVSKADADLQSNSPFYNRVLSELYKGKGERSEISLPEDQPLIIEAKNVSFHYNVHEPAIVDNLSFTIHQGERVALLGASGTGKSTILKLITGMLKPSAGRMTIAEREVGDINDHSLLGKIAYIKQDNLLFNMTIRENLLLAAPQASIEQLNEACSKAGILEFIQSLPDQYETVIGERGVKLSGGQRQRLVLARMFLRDVSIIIFDEATSAVDQYTESMIHDAIEGMGRDKTIIIVSHRESSISLCDRVIDIKGRMMQAEEAVQTM